MRILQTDCHDLAYSPMSREIRRRMLFGFGASVICPLFGQSPAPATPNADEKQAPIRTHALPPGLAKYAAPLLDRLGRKGSERGAFGGMLTLVNGRKEQISWTWEFPGKLRIMRGPGVPFIIFDPARSFSKAVDGVDDALLEALSSDTTDAFLDNVQGGNVPRMLGERFQVPGATGFGSRVDIFEHAIPIRTRNGGGSSVKHYMFDSATGLLSRVAYSRLVEGAFSPVTTRYFDYKSANGFVAAGRVVRMHGKTQYFSLELQSSAWSAGVADGLFQE